MHSIPTSLPPSSLPPPLLSSFFFYFLTLHNRCSGVWPPQDSMKLNHLISSCATLISSALVRQCGGNVCLCLVGLRRKSSSSQEDVSGRQSIRTDSHDHSVRVILGHGVVSLTGVQIYYYYHQSINQSIFHHGEMMSGCCCFLIGRLLRP